MHEVAVIGGRPASGWRTREAERVTGVMSAGDRTSTCGGVAGDGSLMAGDAAAFMDPIFSSGFLPAMTSGEEAADLLDNAPRRGRPDRRRSRAFKGTVLRRVHAYRRMMDLFHSPGFAAPTFHPTAGLDPHGGLMRLLEGKMDHGWSARWRLEIFHAPSGLFARLGVGPGMDPHRVVAGEIEHAGQGARTA